MLYVGIDYHKRYAQLNAIDEKESHPLRYFQTRPSRRPGRVVSTCILRVLDSRFYRSALVSLTMPSGDMEPDPLGATRKMATLASPSRLAVRRSVLASILFAIVRRADAKAAELNGQRLTLTFRDRSIETPLEEIGAVVLESDWRWWSIRIVFATGEVTASGLSRRDAKALAEALELERSREFLDRVEARPLTDEQRRAVVVDEGRNLVVTAAGSGKTSVIVAKAGWLLHRGFRRPSELLLLAFARNAQEEMEQRVRRRLGEEKARGISVRTFHSLGMSIIGDAEGKRPTLAKGVNPIFS